MCSTSCSAQSYFALWRMLKVLSCWSEITCSTFRVNNVIIQLEAAITVWDRVFACLTSCLEECRMRQNPYPEETVNSQPTDVLPRRERMEDLPTKPQQPLPSTPPTMDIPPEVESAETRQEEARTVRYA